MSKQQEEEEVGEEAPISEPALTTIDLETYVKFDYNVPEEVKARLWGLLSRHAIWSNLNEREIEVMLIRLKQAELLNFMMNSDENYSLKDWLEDLNIQLIAVSILSRGRAGFERRAETTHIRVTHSETPQKRLGGLLGLFRR